MSGATLRRLLHAVSAAVLLIPLAADWNLLRVTLAVVAVLALALDSTRIKWGAVSRHFRRLVPLFRPAESARLNGATWLCLGYALAAWFPPLAPVGGILVAALADPAASLVGTWGRDSGHKTLRGSAAALAVSLAALWLVGFSWPPVICGAVVGTILERWSGPLDDNLLIAPGVACVVWLTA